MNLWSSWVDANFPLHMHAHFCSIQERKRKRKNPSWPQSSMCLLKIVFNFIDNIKDDILYVWIEIYYTCKSHAMQMEKFLEKYDIYL